jgi:hypothetical protein
MLVSGVCPADDGAFEFGGHTKYRFTANTFPNDSLFRDLAGANAVDGAFESRLKFGWDGGSWDFRAAAQLAALYGDTVEYSRDLGDGAGIPFPRLPSDDRRLFDLTHIVTDKNKLAALYRLDRLSVGYTVDKGVVRFGRQAVTWGNGLIYNTVMDIFNPFDPTAVDQEYKAGDDMLYGQYLRDNGDDLQGVMVFRRDPVSGDLERDQSSLAIKYHGVVGSGEYDALAARNYGENLIGLGGSLSVGGAVWRGDVTATFTDDDGTVISAVTNLSQSFVWGGRNVSGVVEYYYNGFGQPGSEYGPRQLADNPELVERLARRELFNIGRHYLGVSALIEMTPLFQLTPTVFANLGDPSALIQLTTRNDLREDLLLLGALSIPVGASGTEYGGPDSGRPGETLSTGPGIFLQLAWYF